MMVIYRVFALQKAQMFYNEQYKDLDIHDTTEKVALHSDF